MKGEILSRQDEYLREDEPPGKRAKLEKESQDQNGNEAQHMQEGTSSRKNSGDVEPNRPLNASNLSNETTSIAPTSKTMPPQLLTLLQEIQSTLRTNFPHSPPHTIQRLAELVLYPKQHYRTLPSFLRALDRIVSVASSVSEYPLPTTAPILISNDTNHLFNVTGSPNSEQDDKDFIGGAELTPIPWLRDAGSPGPGLHNGHTSDLRTESTSVIDGPNGAGSVETVTVTVNGVPSTMPASQAAQEGLHESITQGELIRQEQEAGITPVPSGSANSGIPRSMTGASSVAGRAAATDPSSMDGNDTTQDSPADEEEMVHARGPSVIGMEDMGPQAPGSGLERGVELEGPLGIREEGETTSPRMGNGNDGEGSDGGSSATLVADTDEVAEEDDTMDEGGGERES